MRSNTGDEALRADAEHNRAAVVTAAREAFATEGVGVSLAEIARRAGVGFSTAHRRFPSRGDLLAAVLSEQMSQVGGMALTLAGDTIPDAWDAFAAPILACCAHQAREPGLAGALAQQFATLLEDPAAAVVEEAFESLAERARSAGVLRDDIRFQDVLLLIKANAGVVANSPGTEMESSNRFMQIALEAFKA